ncbi:hypothetical protein FHT70_005963 [Rhizobium sp. BK049]|nr:hypothetical protein [Rhizobium sp. BK049]
MAVFNSRDKSRTKPRYGIPKSARFGIPKFAALRELFG